MHEACCTERLAISARALPLAPAPTMDSPQQATSLNASDDTAAPKETDPSGTILSMYLTRVQKFEDEKNVENWKGGADGILVFVRFCSA